MSFHHDSDWTVEAEATPSAAAKPMNNGFVAALGLAAGIAIGALVTGLVLRGSPPAAVHTQASPPADAAQPVAATPTAPSTPAVLVADDPAPASAASASTPSAVASSPGPLAFEAPKAGAAPLSPAEAKRKELAWARFYKRPTECEGNPSADLLIECANHFIRAKRAFDERWRAGTI